MGKTSFKKMQELSKKLHKKIEKIESGKLGVEDLEEVVEQARELYERLLILKYKAYEKYGEPETEHKKESEVEEKSPAEEEKVEVVHKKEEEQEETSFDFTGVTEEIEQPSFDFSDITDKELTEEVEDEVKDDTEIFPEADDIKSQAPKEDSNNTESTFPEADDVKTKSDLFKESHVEKREMEDENSLNKKLGDEEALTLRKKLQSTPIKDLKSEISIAKKFEYITFMFGGDNNNYEEAINVLNNCTDADDAREKLNNYSSKYSWDLENKSIIKFVELVERRYL